MSLCCSLCDVTFPDEGALVGIVFQIEKPGNDALAESYAKQLHPYKLDTKYLVCYPCWFKSMGLKP